MSEQIDSSYLEACFHRRIAMTQTAHRWYSQLPLTTNNCRHEKTSDITFGKHHICLRLKIKTLAPEQMTRKLEKHFL